VVQTVSFVFCSLKADNGYVDVFWGMLFVFPVASLAVLNGVRHQNDVTIELLIVNPRYLIVLICEAVWCARLSIHIWCRHTEEDFRFKRIRDKCSVNGPCWMHIDFIL